MPLLPQLVSPEELRDALGDERVRVFDATVFLRRAVDGGPYTVESGRESYARAHIPGAGFADIPGALSDPASPYAFTLPAAEHFAAAAGRLGIGDGTHVVAYAQDTPMWATRLWWLLRYFGHDDTSVLDGGLVAWRAAGGPVEPGESTYPPASFTVRPRPELLRRRTASARPPSSPPPLTAAVSARTGRSSPTAAVASPRRSTSSRSG